MRSIYGRLAVVALLSIAPVLAEGCQRAASTTAAGPSTNRNMLTKAQLGDARFTTAYDAVESLRSNWLNSRGADSFNKPSVVRVYLDNVSLGDTQTLRTIAIQNVAYMQWFDGITASSRWGLDHGAGVIYVSTRPASARDPQPR